MVLAVAVTLSVAHPAAALQGVSAPPVPFEVKELAAYRLTAPVFEQFSRATRLIGEATRNDPAFVDAPLFTRDISVSGDAVAMAAALEARLQKTAVLAAALRSAGLTAREYTKFALTLFAARLAYGFVRAGVLSAVPAGVPTDNVKFVGEHEEEIAAVLKAVNVSGL